MKKKNIQWEGIDCGIMIGSWTKKKLLNVENINEKKTFIWEMTNNVNSQKLISGTRGKYQMNRI